MQCQCPAEKSRVFTNPVESRVLKEGSRRAGAARPEGKRGEALLDEVKVLKAYLAERVEDGSGYLFLSQKGGAMSRQHFHTLFQSLAEEAGIPEEKRHPHVLKHSIATHLIGENVNLAVVQQKLGHRSISSTLIYVGISGEQVSEACDGALLRAFGR
jgi:site-specific recombinase XerD